jgi:GH15 family glucan-1,4-alpha-glucosidase
MGDRPETPRRPIPDHGVIGNMTTVALVALDGAVDFLCWPHLDSPSIFAGLLDPEKGGLFELSPQIDDARVVQMYMPETNVLVTRWLGESGSAEIVDLMPTPDDVGECICRLIRRVRATRGEVRIRLRCAPRFDYARLRPTIEIQDGCARFSADGHPTLRLSGPVALQVEDDGATATFTLQAGEQADFVLDQDDAPFLDAPELEGIATRTVRYWQAWAQRSNYKGRWRDAVTRSALVLKLLTSHRHGSIAAAATFGLPEAAGGARNWDYRAAWIRDASFTVYSLMRLGYLGEATAFNRWIADRAVDSDGRLDVLYAIDGSPEQEEITLDHLAGYGGARPVRIGNAAAGQLQLDIYGELLDSVYLSNKYGEAISHADWLGVRRVVDYVCKTWNTADAGIWEVRREPSEHLHSRLMCWVAVDRAIRLASKRSLTAPFDIWIAARNAISDDIWANFWNKDLGCFVQTKGGSEVDGAILMMPLVRFIGAKDPAWLATLDVIGERLTDDGLVKRYANPDGLEGQEGAFAACSFWYVECLARAGRLEQARTNFEKLLLYGNHLQLYAEEFDVRGQSIGNFPQAFTHLALISAAFYLDRQIDGNVGQQWQA